MLESAIFHEQVTCNKLIGFNCRIGSNKTMLLGSNVKCSLKGTIRCYEMIGILFTGAIGS